MKLKLFAIIFFLFSNATYAQDGEATEAKKEPDKRPVRSPFANGLLIDNQTIVIPSAKTLEFIIHHRFGTMENGIDDLFGIYAPSNIRLGFNFSILDNLLIGIGTTKDDKLQDALIKWNILQQTRSGSMPLAVTYYGNMAISAKEKSNFDKFSHRFSYFHQLIIARKWCKAFTLQIAPSLTHYNIVDTLTMAGIKHDNFAISASGRVKISSQTSIIFEIDQPLTFWKDPNDSLFYSPKPNIGLGIEFATTDDHAFQIFLGSYSSIINQKNTVYNTNDYTKGEILLGFNMTRSWHF